jgi:hypothetical protein
MNPGRAALRIVADSHLSLGDEAYTEHLLFFWSDLYQDESFEPPLTISHVWGDSMVLVSMLTFDEEGRPGPRVGLQLTAESLVGFAETVLEVMGKRDVGDVSDA